jgi:Cadherin domain
MARSVVLRVVALCTAVQLVAAQSTLDEECGVSGGGQVVRRITVPHDASPGFVVTSVAFIGQTMTIDGVCSSKEYSGRFDIMPNGDVIAVADITDLIDQDINLVVHSQLRTELWSDQIALRVADGVNMIRFKQNSYEGHVFENLPAGSLVRDLDNLKAHADDVDPRFLRYALVDGPSELFELLREQDGTLQLLTRGPLDREVESQYVLTIASVVHAGNQDPAFTKVWIHVDDVNDNEPLMSSQSYKAHINKSSEAGQEIIIVRATDADGDEIEYNLIGGDGYFGINKNNGSVFLLRPGYDMSDEVYEMKVYATDSGEVPSRSSSLQVFVNGVPSQKRKFNGNSRARREVRPAKQIEVPESMIGEVLDLDNNYYEVFALKEPAPKILEVHPASGTVRLRNGEKFDYELQREINFTILITRVDDPTCEYNIVARYISRRCYGSKLLMQLQHAVYFRVEFS